MFLYLTTYLDPLKNEDSQKSLSAKNRGSSNFLVGISPLDGKISGLYYLHNITITFFFR